MCALPPLVNLYKEASTDPAWLAWLAEVEHELSSRTLEV